MFVVNIRSVVSQFQTLYPMRKRVCDREIEGMYLVFCFYPSLVGFFYCKLVRYSYKLIIQ